ncbi:MBL fold metallo-hydrolase [Nonomuraea sp. NPDC050536]|uniref:MBL fold metallo-hydrolase n=1 Tax=Nonomuraea sp. NPDC050536 TaxID=3364366 RepID=UPI0037CBD790
MRRETRVPHPSWRLLTHGHGDHWFNTGLLAERFGARVVATEGTIGQMHVNVAARPFVWDKVFPGIPESPVTAVTVPDNRFTLEGKDLAIVEVGYTDTDADTGGRDRRRHSPCGMTSVE